MRHTEIVIIWLPRSHVVSVCEQFGFWRFKYLRSLLDMLTNLDTYTTRNFNNFVIVSSVITLLFVFLLTERSSVNFKYQSLICVRQISGWIAPFELPTTDLELELTRPDYPSN